VGPDVAPPPGPAARRAAATAEAVAALVLADLVLEAAGGETLVEVRRRFAARRRALSRPFGREAAGSSAWSAPDRASRAESSPLRGPDGTLRGC